MLIVPFPAPCPPSAAPRVPRSAFRRATLFALGVSLAGALAACGGGSDSAPGDPPLPVTDIDSAQLVLTDEQRDDGTYALYQVDVRTGAKVRLDQGGKAPYTGRIIGQRAFFVRAVATDEVNGAVTDSDLFSVRLDGADLKQLTIGSDRDERILPVGDRLVFSRVRKVPIGKKTQDVMSVRLDGRDLKELATDGEHDELAMLESTGDVVIIEATAPDGKKSLWTRPADGSLPAVSIAAAEQYLAYRTRVGDRIIFTTPGKVFTRRVDGNDLLDLFANQGDRYYDATLGDNVFAHERVIATGGITTHLHVARVDGSQAPFLFATSSQFAGGSSLDAPDRVFLSKFAADRDEFYVAPFGPGLGTPRLLSSSDRFTSFSSFVGDAVIARRIRYDDPDIGLSTEIVSLRETPTGVQEVVLAERTDQFVDTRAVKGRLVLNTITGLSGGWPLIKHFAVAADGANVQPLLEDGPGSVHESVQVRQDGQAIFRRTEYKLDGSESLGSELLSVSVADGQVVRLSPFSKDAHVVPKY